MAVGILGAEVDDNGQGEIQQIEASPSKTRKGVVMVLDLDASHAPTTIELSPIRAISQRKLPGFGKE